MTSISSTPISTTQWPARNFHKVVDACNKFDAKLSTMWEFYMLDNSKPVGFMKDEFVSQMDWTGTSFIVSNNVNKVHLNPALSPGEDVTEACKKEFIKLCENNKSRFDGFGKWLSKPEFQAVRWLDEPKAVYQMPTPLRGIFGIATAGVHLNVYTIIDGQRYMWVSQRSMTSSYPGMLDQTVAGGMDHADGYNPWTTLEHEAEEEAGLVLDRATKKMSRGNIEAGTVRGPFRMSFYDQRDQYAGGGEGTIEPGVRFVFDMEVPASFVMDPNEDQAFQLKSMREVVEELLAARWKPNSGLTTLESLLRNGYIVDGGDGTVAELREMMQVKLPMRTAE